MDEFQLIEELTRNLKKNNKLIKGPGDDTAVLPFNQKEYLLATTDSIVEGVHFDLSYNVPTDMLWQLIGWKALAVNVSDIFAMGGQPTSCLVSLHIPDRIRKKNIKLFYKGLEECATRYKVNIAGGNVARTEDELVISITLLGKVNKKDLLLREKAKVNDYIYIQAPVGCAGAGLKLLQLGERELKLLVLSQLKPEPASLSPSFKKKYKINSAIDISDGLIQDLNHILQASKKGAVIFPGSLPLIKEIYEKFPDEILDIIMYSGEDYRLIFTSPKIIKVKGFHQIGQVIQKKGIYTRSNDGLNPLDTNKGFKHF